MVTREVIELRRPNMPFVYCHVFASTRFVSLSISVSALLIVSSINEKLKFAKSSFKKQTGDSGLPDDLNKVLQGTTLGVYLYIAKCGKPVGPRDVMRALDLGSSSVAFRHIQKLEEANLVEKNEYGEYFLKEKTTVKGFKWVGRRMLPNSMVYFYLFLGLLITELVVFAIHFNVETLDRKIFFVLGILITGIAAILFLKEGLTTLRKIEKAKP